MTVIKKAIPASLLVLLLFTVCASWARGEVSSGGIESAVFTELVLGQETQVDLRTADDHAYFSFTPKESAYYECSSAADRWNPSRVTLYNAEMQKLFPSSSSIGSHGFRECWYFEADETYYMDVYLYSSDPSGSFPVLLQKAPTEGSCGENLTWSVDGEYNLFISGSGGMPDYNTVSMPWYAFRDRIVGVTFREGVTSIGSCAFYNFPVLSYAILPDGLTVIGESAFQSCSLLSAAVIPETVREIGKMAFYDCKALSSAVFSEGLTQIGSSAFYGCSKLTAVTLPDSLTVIGDRAFYACSGLKTATLRVPGSVERIGKEAFALCPFTSVRLEEGVREIGASCFLYCDAMTQLSLPVSVTDIGKEAFARCYALTDARYSGNAENIRISGGNGWLNRALGVQIADTGVCGADAVWTLYTDGHLVISGSGPMEDYQADSLWGQVTGGLTPWDYYRKFIASLTVEDGITSIGNYAFPLLEQMTEATLPDSVTRIGDYAFHRTGIAELALPAGLRETGFSALSDMSYLLDLRLPDGIEELGEAVFQHGALRSIVIPASLTSVAESAFRSAIGLTDVYFEGTQAQWQQIVIAEDNEPLLKAALHYGYRENAVLSGQCGDAVFFTLDENGTLTVSGSGPMYDFALTTQSGYSINGNTGYYAGSRANVPWGGHLVDIRKIVVAPGVTRIGSWAFYNCYRTSSAELPDTLESIGEGAFHSSSVTQLSIPDSVVSLDESAFAGCFALTGIRLSGNIKEIPEYCFRYCNALLELTLPSGVRTIAETAFSSSRITDLTIPATVTSVGDSMGLRSGNGRYITVRFLGGIPEGLPAGFMTGNIRCIICPPESFDAFRDYLLPYLERISYTAYDNTWIGMLSTGASPLTLNARRLTLYDGNTYRLSAGLEGDSSGVTTHWTCHDGNVTVSADGTVRAAAGMRGGCLIYGESTGHGIRTVDICKLEYKSSDISTAMLHTLPTENISPNHIVTSSVRVTSATNGILSYMPKLYVESDTENPYYQELLRATEEITGGCETDREKTEAIMSWIGSNITYTITSLCIGEDPNQAYAVYYNRTGNCQGFSKLAGFMLSLAGVPSGIITNSDHMWNTVYLDGEWVMLDAQLGKNAFHHDYSSSTYDDIQNILFAQGPYIYAVDEPGAVRLVGFASNEGSGTKDSLTGLDLPEYVTSLFGESYQSADGLTNITIPGRIRDIGYRAFYACSNLETVILEDGTLTIGSSAFSSCGKLSRVLIPRSVENIAETAFLYSSVTIYCYENSAAHRFAQTNELPFVLLDRYDGALMIPAGVRTIGSEAFANLTVTHIMIPSSVEQIADDAFASTDAVLVVEAGSMAETWAREHEMFLTEKE